MAQLWVGRSGVSPMTREVFDPENQDGVREGFVRLATVQYSNERRISCYSETSKLGAHDRLRTEPEQEIVELVRVIYRDNHKLAWDFHCRLSPLRQSKDPFQRYLAEVWTELVRVGGVQKVRDSWVFMKDNEELVQKSCNSGLWAWQCAAELLKYAKPKQEAAVHSGAGQKV